MKQIALLFSAIAFILVAGDAGAQNAPQQIGTYKDWSAWVYKDTGGTWCYVSSKPTKTAPKGVTRGDIHFYVTHRPKQNVWGEVSMLLGYPFAKDREAVAHIGKRQFAMKTRGQQSWLLNGSDTKRVIAAMKAGSDMKIDGLSSRGTKTRDTYSLLGFTAAYNAIGKACK